MPTKDISKSNMAIVTELFKADKFVVMNDDGTLVESDPKDDWNEKIGSPHNIERVLSEFGQYVYDTTSQHGDRKRPTITVGMRRYINCPHPKEDWGDVVSLWEIEGKHGKEEDNQSEGTGDGNCKDM